MDIIREYCYQGGRSLEHSHGIRLENCVFFNGESALKDSYELQIEACIFEWKYPLWYCRRIDVQKTTFLESARSGIWYTEDISIKDSIIEAPKTFRHAKSIFMERVSFPCAKETLWNCENIHIKDCSISGDYLGLNCNGINAENLKLTGNYCFDGAKNIVIRNSIIVSKDAFWNCENVQVYNSIIIGEYLGWNSRYLSFSDCLISSFQALSRIDNLELNNCRFIKTGMTFEKCTEINAHIQSDIGSVFNPTSGRIEANHIHDIILSGENVDKENLLIITEDGLFHG